MLYPAMDGCAKGWLSGTESTKRYVSWIGNFQVVREGREKSHEGVEGNVSRSGRGVGATNWM